MKYKKQYFLNFNYLKITEKPLYFDFKLIKKFLFFNINTSFPLVTVNRVRS